MKETICPVHVTYDGNVLRCVLPNGHAGAHEDRHFGIWNIFEHPSRGRKTHCRHGHEYTVDNTMWHADGAKSCRECRRERQRRQTEQRRANADEIARKYFEQQEREDQ